MIQSNPASSTINTNQAVIFRAKPNKIMFSLLILYLVQTKKGAISTSYTLSSYRPAFLKLLLLLCTPQSGITNQTTLPSGYNFFPFTSSNYSFSLNVVNTQDKLTCTYTLFLLPFYLPPSTLYRCYFTHIIHFPWKKYKLILQKHIKFFSYVMFCLVVVKKLKNVHYYACTQNV